MRIAFGVTAAAVVALTAVVVADAIEPGTATAAPILVEVANDGSRTITLVDPRRSPDAVTRALTDAGIRSQVVSVAAGPSRVNTIVSLTVDGDSRLGAPPPRTDALTLPVGFDGTVVLVVGTPTPAGQPYAALSDPFAAGEPLAGFDGTRSAAAVARAALERGLTVSVFGRDGGPVPVESVGDAEILVASLLDAASLMIRLA